MENKLTQAQLADADRMGELLDRVPAESRIVAATAVNSYLDGFLAGIAANEDKKETA